MKTIVIQYFGAMAVWLLIGAATLSMGASALTVIMAIAFFAGLVFFAMVTPALIGYGALSGILKINSKVLVLIALGLIVWLATWMHSLKPF